MNLQVHLITGPPLNQGMYSTLGRAGSLHQAYTVHQVVQGLYIKHVQYIMPCRVFISSMYSTSENGIENRSKNRSLNRSQKRSDNKSENGSENRSQDGIENGSQNESKIGS